MIPSSQILLALFSLPSPSSPIIFEVGPIALSYHGLLIALGIAIGTWLTGRELARKGYDGTTLALGSLFFVVPLGILGGRLYHVATEYHRYTRNPFPKVLETYDGGLGIYGTIAGGVPVQERLLYPAPRSPFTGRGSLWWVNPGPWLAATVLGRAFLTPLLALPLDLRH